MIAQRAYFGISVVLAYMLTVWTPATFCPTRLEPYEKGNCVKFLNLLDCPTQVTKILKKWDLKNRSFSSSCKKKSGEQGLCLLIQWLNVLLTGFIMTLISPRFKADAERNRGNMLPHSQPWGERKAFLFIIKTMNQCFQGLLMNLTTWLIGQNCSCPLI